MKGQLSLFDIPQEKGKRKPCEYGFKRYLGQKVHISISDGDFIGEVIKIESYYTLIKIKGYPHILVGTPTTFGPVNKAEWEE